MKIDELKNIEDFLYVIKNKIVKSRTSEYYKFRRRMRKLYKISSQKEFLLHYDVGSTTEKSKLKKLSKESFFCSLPKIAFDKKEYRYPGEFIINNWSKIENSLEFVVIQGCPSNINDIITFLKTYRFSYNSMGKKIKKWCLLNLGLTLGDFYDIFIVPQYPLIAVVRIINGKTDMPNT